jgi:hypothetical protein
MSANTAVTADIIATIQAAIDAVVPDAQFGAADLNALKAIDTQFEALVRSMHYAQPL